jgi:flagellar motility protein MotE (MotC chaperone)
MKSYSNIRVIPVVLVAIFGFAVVKIAGLVIDGSYVFDYNSQPAKSSTQSSWAQEMFNFPGGGKVVDSGDITGSVDEKPKEAGKEGGKEDASKKEEAPKPAAPAVEETKPAGTLVTLPAEGQTPVSPSERAVLERLQARRQELDARQREIDIRESLLKAAEKRVESKVEEMKAVESRISTATEQKNEAEAARFKGLVTMYEAMKPKDAAKVFDRLEMPVLFEIASQIAPRKMSDIMGLMSPEVAERLTTEMARRAGGSQSDTAEALPKIEGKMLPQKSN